MKKKIFNYLRFPESLKNTFDRCLFIFCFRSGNNLVVPKNLQHYCRVCNTQLNSCVQAKIHSQGKKHDKRVSYLRFCLESSKFPFTLCSDVNLEVSIIVFVCQNMPLRFLDMESQQLSSHPTRLFRFFLGGIVFNPMYSKNGQ